MPAEIKLERYRDLSRLGTGGMATVTLAEDTLLGRKVALKRMNVATDARGLSRLRREALVGASINHPNLVSIYDVLTSSEEGDLVIVMEYVPGENLRDAIEREGRLPIGQALRILDGVAAGLDAIHEQGIVHRDVKPPNILLGTDGAVKLADLGIASVPDRTRITTAGTVLGSFSYMAPEQLEDVPPTKAIDIYALATVAFEALSGVKARRETTPIAVAHAIATQPPPKLRDVWPDAPPAAADVLEQAMAREPEQRPGSARHLVGQLRQALASASAESPPAPRTAPTRVRGRRDVAAGAAAAAGAGAAAGGARAADAALAPPAPAPAAPAPAAPAPAGAAPAPPASAPAEAAAQAPVRSSAAAAHRADGSPDARAPDAGSSRGPGTPPRRPADRGGLRLREPVSEDPGPRRRGVPPWLLAGVPLALVAAAIVVAVVLSSSGANSSASHSATTAAHHASPATHTATSSGSAASSGSGASAGAGSATSSSPNGATTQPAASTPTTAGTPATAATPPTGAGGAPVNAVESFYENAAGHRYAAAWALADPAFRDQLGGYSGFQAGQSADRSITFNSARTVSQSAGSATVAVTTTSVRSNGTQHCSGTVQLVPGSGSGTWLLHQIAIDCT